MKKEHTGEALRSVRPRDLELAGVSELVGLALKAGRKQKQSCGNKKNA